jgi:hypothetical protein
LKELQPFDLLNMLGFTDGQLERLIAISKDGENPENVFQSIYQILIECADEAEQLRIIERLQKEGINCRALIA